MLLWETVLELMVRPPGRELLDDVTSLDHVIELINKSNNIIVLSGAGVSVLTTPIIILTTPMIIDICLLWYT